MQSTVLPVGTCDEIDKLCRNFIWGDDDTHRSIHLLNWEKICKPKANGGLGLRSTREANTAYIMKGIWNFCSQPNSLWGSVIRSKYKCGWRNFPKINCSKKGSNMWNGIVNNWESFRSNLCWQLGNGEDIRFWQDIWLPNDIQLSSQALIPISEEDSKLAISHYSTYSGDWNWGLLENILPENVIAMLTSFPPPSVLQDDDSFSWGATLDGNFTTKSAYLALTSGAVNTPHFNFKYVWNWKGNERIRTFLWKLAHEAVLTNVERRRRTMTADALCPICRVEEETLFHRFRDCSASLAIWSNLRVRNQDFFSDANWKNWLKSNLCTGVSRGSVPSWSTLFGVTLYLLWQNRNDFIFSQKTYSTHASVLKIRHHCEGIQNCMRRSSILSSNIVSFEAADEDKWIPPPPNYVKINSDGSVRELGRIAGCGGVARDENGEFLFGFMCKLQGCTSLEAELAGILHGLQIAWQKNYVNVVIETDSIEALELLVGGYHEEEQVQRMVLEILRVGDGQLNRRWRKVDRCHNCVADKLSKLGHTVNGNAVIYNSTPDFLVSLLALDIIGLAAASLP